MRKKIYISGQISGLEPSIARHNFELAEDYLRDSVKAYPVNPLKNGLPLNSTWIQHMRKDLCLLLECEGVYMLHNWEDSIGAELEHNVAKALSMDIIYQGS